MGIEELLAGCPFTGFKKCRGEKCYFFVAVPPELKNHECLFLRLYFMLLSSTTMAQLESLETRHQDFPSTTFQLRADQLIEYTRRCLDGLLAHPHAPDTLKQAILKLQSKAQLGPDPQAAKKHPDES